MQEVKKMQINPELENTGSVLLWSKWGSNCRRAGVAAFSR
jgi:hypothetical protein